MLKKSVWMLKGKPVQSIIQILLVIIIAFTLLAGIMFKETGEFIKSGGTFYYTVKVEPKAPEGTMSLDIIQQLAGDPNIQGYNYNLIQKAQPENFKNWVEYYHSAYVNLVELSINLNTEFSDIFANNSAILTEGVFPTENNHGVVVEQSMAEYNNLKIGDKMELKTTDGDASLLSLIVLGIYQLKSPIEVEEAVGGNISYIVSPYSRLYTNFDSIISNKNDIIISYVDFYTLKEENMATILNILNNKMGNTLEAIDSTNTMFVVLNQAVNKMTQYYSWIIYTLVLTGLVTIILFTIFTQHKNMYEIAILSVLGKSKKDILFQNILNVFILSGISNVIFITLALVFSKSMGLFWISTATKNYTIEVSSFSFQTEQKALINNYTLDNSTLIILGISLVMLFISILIAVVYHLFILKLTPLKRMDRAN